MGYQPRAKSPRRTIHEYRKTLRERTKEKKRLHRREDAVEEQKPIQTGQEAAEATLKRLHTLGIQKFGSSPFSEHFDRWLINIEAVLEEFESNPNINVDEPYLTERQQALGSIKQQLGDITHREATLNQELTSLSDWRNQLKQINTDYATQADSLRAHKNREIKDIYSSIDRLKSEQFRVIRLKTGFFHGLSKKGREQKELEVAQQLSDKQNELEQKITDFSAAQKSLKDQYEDKRAPVVKQIRSHQRTIEAMETDSSLEDRWFACEALADAVNSLLQRRASERPN